MQWANTDPVAIQYIELGKPNQNAYIERFNRTFRDEFLYQPFFARIEDTHESARW